MSAKYAMWGLTATSEVLELVVFILTILNVRAPFEKSDGSLKDPSFYYFAVFLLIAVYFLQNYVQIKMLTNPAQKVMRVLQLLDVASSFVGIPLAGVMAFSGYRDEECFAERDNCHANSNCWYIDASNDYAYTCRARDPDCAPGWEETEEMTEIHRAYNGEYTSRMEVSGWFKCCSDKNDRWIELTPAPGKACFEHSKNEKIFMTIVTTFLLFILYASGTVYHPVTGTSGCHKGGVIIMTIVMFIMCWFLWSPGEPERPIASSVIVAIIDLFACFFKQFVVYSITGHAAVDIAGIA